MQSPNRKNLHLVVEDLLKRHRGRTALEDAQGSCSYGELDQRSAALAALLRADGVGPGDVVALPMPASIDYVASLLAVVRCGAIFLPLDPGFPPARLQRLLAQARPRAIVGSGAALVDHVATIAGGGLRVVLDGTPLPAAAAPEAVADDDATGYLIATSGSTGEPKLIAGRNKGISHFVHWEVSEFGLGADVRASFLAPPTFDVSLREIFVPLLAGGTLAIPAPEVRSDARRLLAWLRQRRIALLHCVPSLFRLLTRALRDDPDAGPLEHLAHVLLAGEPLYGADVAAWRSVAGSRSTLVNLYGPSETTLAKAFHRIGDDIAPQAIVPLGQPIANTALLVLREGRLCDIGEIGELHIHTPFASNGYWERPELTAQAFVTNPLAPQAQRIYRTGDLARYRADRSVEFVGRSDRQVKVNGVRIELAEVEMAMRSHPAVTEAVAQAFRLADGDNGLAGYYTADAPLDAMALRECMRAVLPDAMLPAWLVQLPEFPRNLNGKVDRRALPRPQALLDGEAGYVAPEGEVECELARLWAQALGLQRVGATSDYLLLGGNSMRAIGLIGRIGQRFGVDLTIRDFFEAGTVRGLAARIERSRPARVDAIPRAAGQETYPLTDAQAGLWLLDRIDGAATLYDNVEWLELAGPLDPDALEAAFATLVARHESLRTAYEEVDGEPRQRILPAARFALLREDLSAQDPRARVRELLLQERRHRFDLRSGVLLRACLLREAPELHHLVIAMHHIACDGWSMALLVRELVAAYGGRPLPGATEAVRMRDVACWLRSRAEDPQRVQAWRGRLADAAQRAVLPADPECDLARDCVSALPQDRGFEHQPGAACALPQDRGSELRPGAAPDLPQDRARDLPRSAAGKPLQHDALAAGRVELTLAGPQLEVLRGQLAGCGATPFMGVAAALAVLLYRHGGSETVILGTPLAGRSRGELAGTVGFLVNTLPLVLRVFPDLSFTALLDRTRQAVEDLAAGEFDNPGLWAAPTQVAAEPARNPFYDVVLAMEPVAEPLQLGGLRVTEHEVPEPPARNDLSLRLQDGGDTLRLVLEYRRALYSGAGMEALLRQLQRLLEGGAREPALPLRRLQMLGADELAALQRWSQGPVRTLPGVTLPEAFAVRAAAMPDAVALVLEEGTVRYGALDERAECIAVALRVQGVRSGDVVGVLLEREADWPAALLGVLKAGAVYLPLDPWHPAARHAALLRDAGARLLITRGAGADAPCPVLDPASVAGATSVAPPVDAASPDAPAYLVYTSGSTGTPKGVLVSHRAFLNMIEDQVAALDMGPRDTLLQFLSPAFDASLFELFVALLSGARLALVDRRRSATPEGLAQAIARHHVTVLSMTPGFLNSLGELPLPGLRLLVLGGEAPIPADLERRRAEGIRTVVAYGPTEAAVCAAFHELGADQPLPQAVPIGRPTANTALHVVAPDGSPLPPGAVGELAIAGAGLALGYHARPTETDRAFVTGTLAGGDARLYLTGDRVRRRADGALVFVGRKDAQVKIRGHRVEPGEVEAVLRRQAGVGDARVVARPIGADFELAAYWTGDASAQEGLRAALARELPEYMVPRVLQRLDALPLNINGKLDASRLPQAAPAAAADASAPRDADEQCLAALWGELLGCAPVGRDANFFELGGRSLAANRLALRAARALGVPVDLRDVYGAPTPAGLAARLRASAARPGQHGADDRVAAQALPRLAEDQPAPLSPMQRRLWVIEQLGESGGAYHITGLLRLTGALDPQALRKAFEDLATRHAVLRTRFVTDAAGEPMQVCDPPGPVPWTELAGLDGAQLQSRLEELAAAPFDLRRDWPLRVVLSAPLQVPPSAEGEGQWRLLVVLHHIAADGWSMPILEQELAQAYAARRRGAAPDWPPLPAQYREVAAWMEQRLAAGAHADDRAWWLERLAPPLPLLDLPTDRPRPAVRRFRGATFEHALAADVVQAAQRCARSTGSSLFTVLLAALQALLSRLSGQEELVIGTPVAGRPHPATEGLVGFFANTLPLRERIDGEPGFAARVAAAGESLRQAMLHQAYPFDRLVGDLRLERDTSRSALFDVLIGLDEPGAGATLEGVQVEPLPLARRGSRCDLTWLFSGPGGGTLRVEYDTDLFDAARIADWVRRFENLLRAAAADAHAPLARLELLASGEREALLRTAAAPASELPAANVLQLFEQQVAARGRQVALRTDAGRWSYGELDRAANRLARRLQRLRSDLQAPVALLCGRGPHMVVAQLAVLKCGAAYLPIEPDAPVARARLLLEDSRAEVLLFHPAQRPDWLDAERAALPLRLLLAIDDTRGEDDAMPPVATGADDPIYVMYTSGSTGRPKGVVAPHRGVVRLLHGCHYYVPQPNDRILQLSNYAFDGATFDWYAALTHGLPLCIPDQDLLLDLPRLADFVRRHEANVSFVTTALFNRIVDEVPELLACFRRLYFGGQDASLPHVGRALERMAPGALVHVYGPTECTTFATWHTVTREDVLPPAVRVPIGQPIGHTSAYLLDTHGMLVPPGTPGELWIGGAGLALGYLGQPELTAQCFVPSPFAPGERLYRTGDLCVRRADGAIDFLGRIDAQVKVRGFRVEPGEVEHHLATHPAVGKVHVLPRRNAAGNTELVAYLTAAAGCEAPTLASLRDHLQQVVPRYMIPSHFVLLPALPLNRNGKVDRAALPPPEEAPMGAAPLQDGDNEAERALLHAWRTVLGRAAIGVHDNYYAIGGDSIHAIQIGARLREAGFRLKVPDLLRHPTIAQLAPLLQPTEAPRNAAAEDADADAPLPLTPIQHWLFEQHLPVLSHFNQSVLLQLAGGSDALRMRRVLGALQARHGALRLRFGRDAQGRPWQRMARMVESLPELPVIAIAGADPGVRLQQEIGRVQRSLAPASGPIWRAALFRLDDGDRLLLTVHHWAVDGVSWRILLEDFADGWAQSQDPEAAIRLRPATDTLQHWSRAMAQAAAGAHFAGQHAYWQQQVEASVGTLPRLAGGAPAPLQDRVQLELVFDAQRTDALFGACHAAYRTRSDELLLAAWVLALTRVQGHPACRLLLEGHGRDALAQVDVERTVGWFTALYPVVFTLAGQDWPDVIREVKEQLRAVPDHGVGFGVLRYLGSDASLVDGQPETAFNYLGRFDHRAGPLPIAPESPGDELDPGFRPRQGLDLSAEVRDGQLHLRLVGDCTRHPEACFHALRSALDEALQGLVAHCMAPRAGGLSPSDVDLPGVGIADLDRILDALERRP